jgi:hypothetical protein
MNDNSDHPIRWRPQQAGETVSGTVLRVEQFRSSFEDSDGQGPIPVVVVETAEGEVEVICSPRLLRDALIQLRPEPGDTVTVEFHGERMSRAGRRFKDFQVRVNGRQAGGGGQREPIDWDEVTAPAHGGETKGQEDA